MRLSRTALSDMNLYQILGVTPDDPDAKIRARYRLLARTTHPDVTKSRDSSEFMRYAEAYKVLSRPDKRQEYNLQHGIDLQPRPLKPGHDLHQRLTISRAEALVGGVFPLSFKRYEPCGRCWLLGCPNCGGHGLIPVEAAVHVRVPAGTQRAITVFVEGGGGVSEPGSRRGDLLVYVSVVD